MGRSLRDGVGVAAAILAILAAAAIVVAAVRVVRTVTSVSSAPLRDVEVRLPGQSPSTGAGPLARGERMTILLLGYGGGRHEGAFLTDSIVLVAVDPERRAVSMLSIPRDLRVRIPQSKYTLPYEAKLNEAFSVGAAEGDRDEGMRVARAALEPVLGLRIDRVVAVDFRAFRAVVDALGGIDIAVDRAFTALYPKSDDARVDPSWITVSFPAGRQHFDGETALRFVRARYSDGPEGSDFARAERQQKVMLAAKDRATALGAIPRLLDMLDALRDNVRTDLSVADLQALAAFAAEHGDQRTTRAALSPLNVLQEAIVERLGYVLLPRVEGWAEVHAYMRRLVRHGQSLAEEPPVVVRAAAPRTSAGQAAVRRLRELGFDARLEVVNGAEPPRTTVADETGGRAAESARFLADYFGSAYDGANGANGANASGALVVHLGADWRPPRELVPPPPPAESPSPSPTATRQPSPGR